MTESIIIRPATEADRPFLDSLDDRLVGEAAVPNVSRSEIVAFQTEYTRQAFAGSEPGTATLIAVDGAGQPLGYVHLEPHADALAGGNSGYVSILAVAAAAEGRGVARRLMAAAEDWARASGFRFLLLDVFASNATARRFYARDGFIEESLRLRRKVNR
jgi:GNAT superfamily N-acetyltransferase